MVWVVNATPRPLYHRERPGTHCIGGWVGTRSGLEGCGKSRPPPGFDPRTVQPVASRYTDWAIPVPIYEGSKMKRFQCAATLHNSKFKVCKSVHHRTIQINHQPDATVFQFIILTFIYSSTCSGRFTVHHQELNDCSSSLWFYLRIVATVVLCSWSGRS
jgi:hypothetical protein